MESPGSRHMKSPSSYIRIRISARQHWIWEHRTADGHVVNTSEDFESREACEADAKRQDLPISGLIRQRKSPQP
jgi:hypothetical protein